MSLQMIYGRAHSGKTQYILNLSGELCKDGKPFVIVVPEQFTHLAEKRLISKIGSIQQDKAEVLSFERIAKRINSIYPNNKQRINSVAKSLIMSELISDIDFEYYKNIKTDTGFIDACISEISEFKKYNYSCKDIAEISAKTTNKALSLKLSDLAKIYTKYEELISSSYADSDDELGILAENLEKNKPYNGYTFIFDEFSSFNPIEKRIISALSCQCSNVYMTFCADDNEKYKYLFKPTLDTASSVGGICRKAGCEVLKPIALKNTYFNSCELEFLEENLFSFPSSVYNDECKDIEIFACENPYDEVTKVASKIKNLVMKENIRYKDISVICTDIASYSHVFRSVFSSFNIPYFIDEKTEVLKHSIVCYCLNILDVYLNNYNSESVINFLKSGYINADRASLIDVDNFIQATNASKNTWLTDEKWNRTLEIYCEGDAAKQNNINNIRRKYILPLASLHDTIKGKNTVKFVSEKIYSFLLKTEFDKNVTEFIKFFKSQNNTYMAKQYESVWKILIDTFDMLVLILGDKNLNLSEYRNYLHTALGGQKIGIIPTSVDSVIIGDTKRSKSEFSQCQFVVGCCDGVFPSPNKDDCIITDADKKDLSDAGFEFSLTSHDNALFDRFLIYSSLTHPASKLVISYPLSDFAYKATRPSFTLTLLKRVFEKLARTSALGDEFSDCDFASRKAALEFLAKSAYNISSGKAADERWKDIYSYFVNNSDDESIKKINSFITPAEPVTKLSDDVLKSLFKDEFYSTISRIQKYNSCRYLYYLEYMLKLSEKKTFEPLARDVGTFVHTILEKTFKHMEETGVSIENTNKEYFEKITAPLFEEYKAQMFAFSDELDNSEAYRFEICKKTVLSSLMHIRSHLATSAFKPIGHEITFDDDNYGCIELLLDNGKKLKITGKIDRADSFENENGSFVRVVDYKTGNKTFNLSEVYHGLDIQLIVYLNTLVKGIAHSHHAGALYLRIHNPIADFTNHPNEETLSENLMTLNAMTGLIADDEATLAAYSKNSVKSAKKATFSQFKALSDHVEDVIKKSALEMSEGNIAINPYEMGDNTPCERCVYKSVCGKKTRENIQPRKLSKYKDNALWKKINSQKGGE